MKISLGPRLSKSIEMKIMIPYHFKNAFIYRVELRNHDIKAEQTEFRKVNSIIRLVDYFLLLKGIIKCREIRKGLYLSASSI